MKTIRLILDVYGFVVDPSRHFILAFLAAFSVCLSILTIGSVYRKRHGLKQLWQESTGVVIFTIFFFLLLSIFISFVSHLALDYGYDLFTMPLGPSLELTIPPDLSR